MSKVLFILSATLCLALVSAMTTPEPPPEDPPCEDGFCCNAFCLKRTDELIPNVRWDCDIHSAVWADCEERFPQCTGDYAYASEPLPCFIGYGNTCEDMSQCCWSNFWSATSLTDRKPGETGIRNRWGDYFCDQAKKDASTPGRYWTLNFQGRAQHCGRLLPNWIRLDDTTPTPELCCTNLGAFDPDCAEALDFNN